MLDETYEVDGNTYQLYRFATIVPVGEGVMSRGRRDHDVGHWEVCYGCPGAPRAVWLWRT